MKTNPSKNTFVFSGHQHNLKYVFSFKKPESSNLKYGFANCACIEVTFDTSMNIENKVIYQGMKTEKGVMLDSNNTMPDKGEKGQKYGYVNGNINNIVDSPQIKRTRSKNATNEDKIAKLQCQSNQLTIP